MASNLFHVEPIPDDEFNEAFVLDRQCPGLRVTSKPGDAGIRDTWDGVAKIIMREVPILKDTAYRLYYYKDGYFRLDYNEQVLKCLISAYCTRYNQMELVTPFNMQKIISYIANISSPVPALPPPSVINFKNGMYGITKKLFVPHHPQYQSLIQIPVDYNPQAHGTVWAEFIESVVPGDCVEAVWRVVGLLLIPFTRAQKAIILLGTGSNGKGIFLVALQKLIGSENYSVLRLNQINDRFSTSLLVGKLANIATEESIAPLEDSAIFKTLVAGEPLSVDIKHKQPLSVNIFSRLVLAINELPKTMDTSYGFFRRFSIVRFPHTFAEDPAKAKEIAQSLADPYEQSSAINRALEYLPSTIEVGILPSKSMQKELNRYVDAEVPERAFLAASLVDAKNGTIPRADIYRAYVEWCKERGLKVSIEEHFWRYARSVRRDWTFTRVRLQGELTYVLMGCAWKDNS